MLDPQRFNLYNYGRGNPLKYVDPDGRDINLVNDTENGRKKALAMITKNMSPKEAANIDAKQDKNGRWQAQVKDAKAINMKNASVGYKNIVGLINDHSINANVGLLGGGLTATFPGPGQIRSTSRWAETLALQDPNNGKFSKDVSVMVTQGDYPGGIQVFCCNGKGVYQGVGPDFINMYHELIGETMKYRAGHGSLQNDPQVDSRTVIKIENEIRDFHQMNPRTGSDHGSQVITVTPR